MARLSVNSPRIRRLVQERVVPLYLATGSTAALTKVLNDGLGATGGGGVLHPNRLHALLSNDASRGLNEATVEAVERAVDAVASDPALKARASETAERLRGEVERARRFGDAAPDELSQQLGIPSAVLATLWPADGSKVGTDRPEPEPLARSDMRAAPDWSFQDTAVARCLTAFKTRPAARIGLVLPTGAGKTRTALRVVLALLADGGDAKAPVYWVTHRKNLRTQAHRELQKVLSTAAAQVPDDAMTLLANRIRFVMISEVGRLLASSQPRPALVVVDEAHHAAAPSYAPIFDAPWPVPVLLLTATPNRGDRLPIGMDEVAFTITYRELAERGAILTPKFLDFPVEDFDWSPAALRDLVDYVVDRTAAEFTKALILAPRVDRVEEFYEAMRERLASEPGHPLAIDDIGFVHGGGNSLGVDNETFLAQFAVKPRALLVSAQILLEGFDDPAINTVVLTYPSASVIRLMQAAGRCVRFAPEKRAAYVVQARNDQIAYHFDHRWLYQEIDDYLRPELLDLDYGSAAALRAAVADLLRRHNVDRTASDRIMTRVDDLGTGETCRVLLYGLPYYGDEETFAADARWGALLETADTSAPLRGLFNGFCALGADLSDPSDYLARDGARFGIVKDLSSNSRWVQYSGLLTAAYLAKQEVHGAEPVASWGKRPYRRAGSTTWLKYVTFHFRPAVPPALSAFLDDCHNAAEIEAAYLRAPEAYTTAAKVPLPLAGSEAFLLDGATAQALDRALRALRLRLSELEPGEQFGAVAAFLVSADLPALPHRLTPRLERLLGDAARASRLLFLTPNNDPTILGG